MGVVLFFAAVSGAFAFSQFSVDANPAEYFNPRAAFTNPGIIMDQRYQIHGGVRMFHLGFEPGNSNAFRQTMLNFVQPYSIAPRWGYAINVTSLSIPSITQNELSLAIARKITDVFTLGASGSFLTQSITEFEYDNVEVPGDPALHGPLQLDMTWGAGLFVGPVNNFSFGLGVHYLNEPDISVMGDNFPLKVKFDVGMCYTFKSFTPSFSLNYSNKQTFYRVGVYGRRESVGIIGLFYGTDQISIEGELDLFDNRVALGYRFDYQINEIHSVSSGSHQLGFTYRLAEPDHIVFQISSDLNRMILYEDHLTIDIDSAVTRKDLARMKEYNLDVF
ncbi:type IX secretion system membrane protein PorP/SprF, partial [bacterium]|nr:type IX secretion system membrane protein PorP/SprF [bacterium]